MGLSKEELIKAIGGHIATPNKWYIGITENPKQRKEEHGNPVVWYEWEGQTEKIAREVEKYWLDKGCKGGTGGGEHPHWVYIYM